MSKAKTFSESWYRIAGVEVSLRPTVRVRRQRFRGSEWYVLQDPFNNKFFRLSPEGWHFVSQLEPGRTVEDVWRQCLELDPEGVPGQEEVIRLLTQLHHTNLLYYNTPSDSERFFARYHKRKQRELKATLASLLFARIPLIDPDDFLVRFGPFVRPLFGIFGLAVWLIVVLWAGKLVIDNVDVLAEQAQGVLAPDNLFLLYMGMVVIKSLHELGHAIVCRHYGGEVHTMGFMFIVFTPLPYMDATSSWAFRNRWERVFVGAAGMITEIFIAALATFVWAYTGQGTINALAYNMMFVASVSTVLFNSNPLIRFDGYYIFSDLVDVPNLYKRSREQIRYFAERLLFGLKDESLPAQSMRGALGLSIYAILSTIYRVFVFVGILLIVGDQYLILGLLMAIMLVFLWAVGPPYKLIKYLISSPKLAQKRPRAIAVTCGLGITVLLVLTLVPFGDSVRAPGVVQAAAHVHVTSETAGYLEELLVEPGSEVNVGTPLLRLSNREIDNRLVMIDAQLRYQRVDELRARSSGGVDLAALAKRRASIELKQSRLLEQRDALVVRATQDGIWVAPDIEGQYGMWLNRGVSLGSLIDQSRFDFAAVVLQDEASTLFDEEVLNARVRLRGQSDKDIEVVDLTIIPFQQQVLPSAALGWAGGGNIPVDMNSPGGLNSLEPFFRINASLTTASDVAVVHGLSGEVRLTFSDKPLLTQWVQSVRQVLQRRYRL